MVARRVDFKNWKDEDDDEDAGQGQDLGKHPVNDIYLYRLTNSWEQGFLIPQPWLGMGNAEYIIENPSSRGKENSYFRIA